jgi:hypothetical protein
LEQIEKIFHKIAVSLLYLMLIYLPFSELFLHFLESKTMFGTNMVFWITHFYEPILLIVVLFYLIKLAARKELKTFFKDNLFVSIFIFLAIILVLIRPSELSRGLEGLRFLLLPFGVYFLARLSDYKNPKTLIKIYLVIAIAFATIGVFEFFFLTPGYWAGYLGIFDFGYGENSLIATSQATSLLAGPNQLASYLILAFFYLMHRFFVSKKSIILGYENLFLVLVALAIGLTYSRSALVGLAVSLVFMLIYFGRQIGEKISQSILFLVVAVSSAVIFAMYNGEFLHDILLHGSSFSQHLGAAKDGILKLTSSGFLALFFGSGVGSAGPTALKIGGTIPENYYLQVVFEVGIVGLGLLLIFIAGLIKKLFSASKTLFFALVALLTNALFLHIFSDNPAMAVTIFILIALVLNVEDVKKTDQVTIAES